MRKVDVVVLVLFVIALVVLFILRQCSLDIYFFILGLAVAAMSAIAMYMQRRKDQEDQQEAVEQ